MPSQLLSLPGELRNKVYALVLSEAEGLDYIRSGPTLGKLCLHELRAELIVSSDEVPSETAVVSTSQTSSTPTTDRGGMIANQLQYVCRQLRCETKNLEVLYNIITFTCPKAETFLLFIQSLQPYLQSYSHSFVLKAPVAGWTSDMFRGLPEFCRAYPRCSLKFYHPKLSATKPLSILFTTLLVKYGARKDTLFVQKLTNDASLQRRILEVLPGKVEDQLVALIPKNITFYPYDMFDESAFVKACNECELIRDVLVSTLTNGVNDLVAIAKDSYTHGF